MLSGGLFTACSKPSVTPMTEAIVVALITGGFGVLIALVQRSRKENSNDHATVVKTLERVETKIDTHINDHARGDV